MLTEQEKINFALSTIRPMADYTMPFLTQVVGVIDEQSGKHIGSAIFCMIKDQQAIVTAAHVLRQANATGDYLSLAFTRGSGESPTIVAGKIIYSDDTDLAVYFPSKNFPLGPQKNFWPENRIDASAKDLSRDYLFVQGFPQRFSRFTTLFGDALISDSLAYGAMLRYQSKDIPADEMNLFLEESPMYEFLPDDFLKPHEFAFNFSVEHGSFIEPGGMRKETSESVIKDWSELFTSGELETFPGQKIRGAFGLSGSPVWRIGASGKSIHDWSPEWSELVGIVTDWNEAKKILIATSITKVFEIASSD